MNLPRLLTGGVYFGQCSFTYVKFLHFDISLFALLGAE